MARITSETATLAVGSRYDLVLIASRRVRELRNGYAPTVPAESNEIVTALKEIEQGNIGRDYLLKEPNISDKKRKTR